MTILDLKVVFQFLFSPDVWYPQNFQFTKLQFLIGAISKWIIGSVGSCLFLSSFHVASANLAFQNVAISR